MEQAQDNEKTQDVVDIISLDDLPSDLLSYEEAATHFHVKKTLVANTVSLRKINRYRIPGEGVKVRKTDLEKWLNVRVY